MSQEMDHRAESLSPVSRRAFFQGLGTQALKWGLLGAAAASLGSDGDGCRIRIFPGPDDNCGYCDGAGQNYTHCDGDYCDYADYTDESCGYCDAAGQDYDHCDGDYCDYANYADEA